jgi:hypothetical protein
MHGLFTQCVCIYGDIAARKQAGKELAMNIAESTIDFHRNNIRAKLGGQEQKNRSANLIVLSQIIPVKAPYYPRNYLILCLGRPQVSYTSRAMPSKIPRQISFCLSALWDGRHRGKLSTMAS